MNREAKNRYLDQAERALQDALGGRRQSEVSFLQQLMRELGAGGSATRLSPADLFRAVLHNRPLMQEARDALEVLARPLQRPEGALRPGDWILRAVPGTGDVGHVSVLASADLLTPSELESEGIAAESQQPGQYGLVVEAGAFPHSRSRPFARRMLDSRGRVLPNTIVLRPKYPDFPALTDLPPDDPEITLEPAKPTTPAQESAAADTPEESITVDDVAVEMNDLRCRFLSAYRATRADGSARGFSDGALLPIENWNGTGTEATVAGFSVPKLVLEPAPEYVSGMRRYNVALDAQRTAVARNRRELADWVAREAEYRRNHGTWERERARLAALLARRQVTYSRMWVQQMMYNRFDVDIASSVRHYNTQLRPAATLDANIVKSMLYQESRMGTSGEHLMPPPSDWSSGDRHPVRSRFNIGQAIDSWGPQQWLMMREMGTAIFARHGLSAFDRTWMSMSNDDYNAHAPFMAALREFFAFRDGSNRNLMGTTGRDLHEDYRFWIHTAVRWLFVKYANLRSPTWPEAARAYNGGGARARAYRDAVMARVGSTDAYAAESLDSALEPIDRDSGSYTRWVQQSLNRILGLNLAVDGLIGRRTREAIRTFQQREALKVDGLLGLRTERALLEAGAEPQPGLAPSPVLPAEQAKHYTVYGWGQYRRRVEELPADQQAALKGVGDAIIASYQLGSTPVETVDVCGHADWDTPRNSQREQQMSDERARMATQWLMDYIGQSLADRIIWFERGLGARQLKASPSTEENRRKNRRVEIYFNSSALCEGLPKIVNPVSQKGTLVVRVLFSDGTPVKQATVFLYSNPPYTVNDDSKRADDQGTADFGSRNPGTYKVEATAPDPALGAGEWVKVVAGKQSSVTVVLKRMDADPCQCIQEMNLDDKFLQYHDEGCLPFLQARTFCPFEGVITEVLVKRIVHLFGLNPGWDWVVKLLGGEEALADKICHMSAEEIEKLVDNFVLPRVYADIIRKCPTVTKKCLPELEKAYFSWKGRVGKRCL